MFANVQDTGVLLLVIYGQNILGTSLFMPRVRWHLSTKTSLYRVLPVNDVLIHGFEFALYSLNKYKS